jgi:hypothetical protein
LDRSLQLVGLILFVCRVTFNVNTVRHITS